MAKKYFKYARLLLLGPVMVPWFLFRSSEVNLSAVALPPGRDYLLGTDHLGRDVLSRLSEANFHSLPIIWGLISLALLLGWILAAISCARADSKSWSSKLWSGIERLFTMLSALPVFLSVFIMAWSLDLLGTLAVGLCLGVSTFLGAFQQLKGHFLEDQYLAYWQAHEALGGNRWQRIWSYGICQAWRNKMLAYWAHCLTLAVVVEVSLSYLGFGVQEPEPSIGNMMAAHLSDYIHGGLAPLLVVTLWFVASCAIPKVVLGFAFKLDLFEELLS